LSFFLFLFIIFAIVIAKTDHLDIEVGGLEAF